MADWQPFADVPANAHFLIGAWKTDGAWEVGEVMLDVGAKWVNVLGESVSVEFWQPLPDPPVLSPPGVDA